MHRLSAVANSVSVERHLVSFSGFGTMLRSSVSRGKNNILSTEGEVRGAALRRNFGWTFHARVDNSRKKLATFSLWIQSLL